MDYLVKEPISKSHEWETIDFSNHSEHSINVSSSFEEDSDIRGVNKITDFDYAAEMNHFQPNNIDLTNQHVFDNSPSGESKSTELNSARNKPGKNTSFREIEVLHLKRKAFANRLKGSINF